MVGTLLIQVLLLNLLISLIGDTFNKVQQIEAKASLYQMTQNVYQVQSSMPVFLRRHLSLSIGKHLFVMENIGEQERKEALSQ